MQKVSLRTPKNYDGINRTNRVISDVLPHVMQQMHAHIQNRSALVLAAWPSIIGEQFAKMTRAVKFKEGVIMVKVNNSTLYSLLNQHEKPKLLRKLKEKFPNVSIENIIFRIG